jgi:hypothetical protein
MDKLLAKRHSILLLYYEEGVSLARFLLCGKGSLILLRESGKLLYVV